MEVAPIGINSIRVGDCLPSCRQDVQPRRFEVSSLQGLLVQGIQRRSSRLTQQSGVPEGSAQDAGSRLLRLSPPAKPKRTALSPGEYQVKFYLNLGARLPSDPYVPPDR